MREFLFGWPKCTAHFRWDFSGIYYANSVSLFFVTSKTDCAGLLTRYFNTQSNFGAICSEVVPKRHRSNAQFLFNAIGTLGKSLSKSSRRKDTDIANVL